MISLDEPARGTSVDGRVRLDDDGDYVPAMLPGCLISPSSAKERMGGSPIQSPVGIDIDIESESQESSSDEQEEEIIPPVSRVVLSVISIVLFTESFNLTCILPFVAFMVRDFMPDLSDSELGYYVGILVGCYSLGQFFSGPSWGGLADSKKGGTRTVILIGLVGNFFTMLMFGFSASYAWAIAWRSLSGLLNGNIAAAKTFIGETTHPSHHPKVFATIGLVWGIGLVIGPLAGGMLVYPAKKYPSLFPEGSFFDKHPYLLPCLVSCVVTVIGFSMGAYIFSKQRRERREEEEKTNREGSEMQEMMQIGSIDAILTKEDGEKGKEEEEEGEEQMGDESDSENDGKMRDDDEREFEGAKGKKEGESAVVDLEHKRKSEEGNEGKDKSPEESDSEECVESEESPRKFSGRVVSIGDVIIGESDSEDEKNFENEEEFSGQRGKEKDKPGHQKSIVRRIIFGYALLALAYIIFDSVMPLLLLRKKDDGGLEFGASSIGIAQGLMGLGMLLFQLFAFARMVNRLGRLNTYLIGVIFSIPLFSLFPIVTKLNRSPDWVIWSVLSVFLLLRASSSIMSMTTAFILINNSTALEFLGRVNGFAQSMASLMRAIGPMSGCAVFAWSVSSGNGFPLDVFFVYFIISICATVNASVMFTVPRSINHPIKSPSTMPLKRN
eukprot:TRINITY_DN10096_c0_g1_i1.p1 TRINITY_DN10096_c0_g1~~TRINITY_DN10096_c0_g1_i1.p1  ORF type:complete len:668 (+),score=188.60 TRINITY_DN10096_c0_g1_i1:334-2337(+)